MPPIRRKPLPPLTLTPKERQARGRISPEEMAKQQLEKLKREGLPPPRPRRSPAPPKAMPEYLTPAGTARVNRAMEEARARKMCLLGHENCRVRAHFVRQTLQTEYKPQLTEGIRHQGVTYKPRPYLQRAEGAPLEGVPGGAPLVRVPMERVYSQRMVPMEETIRERGTEVEQELMDESRERARIAGQQVPWGTGPRPAYPARVHYTAGKPGERPTAHVKRFMGPEELEEYGAARTAEYFVRGRSMDELGQSHIVVKIAGSPMQLNVRLLGANARKDLVREGLVPPTEDEQVLAAVRAWHAGDKRETEILLAPAMSLADLAVQELRLRHPDLTPRDLRREERAMREAAKDNPRAFRAMMEKQALVQTIEMAKLRGTMLREYWRQNA